ncbi:MAG: phosphoribosyltransferase family protein [Fibrobacterales bacterium]
MKKRLSNIVHQKFALLDALLFGDQCSYCHEKKRKNYLMCDTCTQKLSLFSESDAQVQLPNSDNRLLSLFPMTELTKKIIHDIKYNQLPSLATQLLKDTPVNYFHDIDSQTLLVPVPLHSKRMRERGYNQAKVIAQGVAERTGATVVSHLLKKNHHTGSQTKLGKEERHQNMQNVFSLIRGTSISGKNVVVIDDVFTTGATTQSCINALEKGNPQSLHVFTLVRADIQEKSDFAKELQLHNNNL